MDGNLDFAITDLVDILKGREIKRVYYFHADHFEPWSSGLNEKMARGVERMREMSRASSFGRKLSLFYFPYVPYHLDETKVDAVVFGPRSADQERIAQEVIRPLAAEDLHEMHLHVHHEYWTRNESNFDSVVSKWVNANSTAEMDKARLDFAFSRFKEIVSRETGESFARWAFVHGNWALAASDPKICTIDNELSMIMRHGGFGDFSFPAGRSHCDPKLPAPFTCLPIDCKRAFDEPSSDPRPIEAGAGVMQPDRFFIWNSPIKARYSSLDYYYAPNRELFKDPSLLVGEWLKGSVKLGSDLYIKTHAHSMWWEYKISEPGSHIPHCYPDVIKVFEHLVRVCDRAGVEFLPVTVNEVMALLHSFDGSRAPVLPTERKAGQPAASIRQLVAAAAPTAHAAAGTKDVSAAVTAMHKADVNNATTLEHDLAPTLKGWVHSDPKRMEGAGAFYQNLLDQDHILQDYERSVFEYIVSKFPAGNTRIVEVGVGYGVLSILLAAAGYSCKTTPASKGPVIARGQGKSPL